MIILSYKTMKLKSIWNELWKGSKLAWYHHFTHIACARKLRGLRQKLDALRVQNGQSLSKYQGFIRKLICYKGISFFELISTPDFLCVQNAPFKATSSIFNYSIAPFKATLRMKSTTKTHLLQRVFHFFTFSSLVFFAYCTVTMDNLHRLTGCFG